ncbi:MAG: hypothetical protein WD081_09490 [Gammaproteobacteria bacterium]
MQHAFFKGFVAALVGATMLAPTALMAQDENETPVPKYRIPGSVAEPDRTKRQTGLTERTFNIITSIFEDIGEQRYAEALARLQQLGQTRRLSPYEEATIHRYTGHVHAMMENNREAIRETNIALDAEVLPHSDTQQALLMLASLEAQEENWESVIQLMRRYFYWEDKPTFDSLQIMTVAYATKEDFRNTLLWAQRAIDVSDKPQENMHRIKLWAHSELDEYEEAANVLAQLIALWPEKPEYWEQLAGILASELNREDDSLAVYSMAFQKGLLKEGSKHLNLVRYYLYREAPYTAARILQRSIDDGIVEPTKENWELLSQSYQMAQENGRAIAALQKAAALSDDGELYVREAQLHAAEDNWAGVQRASQNAVDKGGLKNPGRAWMMIGMAAYERDEHAAALRAMREATKHEDSRRGAQQWINYINNQIRIERALREGT